MKRDARSSDLVRSALERSGLSLRQFSKELGTSPSRMSLYVKGESTPSVSVVLRMLDIAGAPIDTRPGRVSAAATVRAINADAVGNPVDAFRWLLQGRDHLLEMSDLEADLKWGELHRLPRDDRWATLLQHVAASAFNARGAQPPDWTLAQRLSEPWTPLTALPLRPSDRLDKGLSALNIFVREKDLVTL